MHGREQAAAKHTGDPQHVERVHQDVVLGLEHQHEVERSANAKGHAIGEGALTEGVDQKHRHGGR